MKNGRKYKFWALFGDLYRYTLNLYWYTFGSGHFWPKCTGTPLRCTDTPDALFLVSTSFRILAITFSFLIRFELLKWKIKKDFKENQT